MRSIPRSAVLVLAVAGAAVAGIAVGAITAAPSRSPEPTIGVAALPTSTPDLRPTLPPQTLTPTQRPTPVPSASAVAVVTTPPTVAPSSIATPRPTPTPEPRGRAVVYVAAPDKEPAAVPMTGSVGGTSESDHVYFRLLALRQQRQAPAGYANVFASLRAQLAETTVVTKGTVVVGFSVPPSGDWGVGADLLKLLLQQIVFTATEEPGIDLVLITQNGGKPAVIGGQAIDKPLGRAELAKP